MWGIKKSKVGQVKTLTKKQKRAGRIKGRSSRTHQNKLNKLTSFYNHLINHNGKFKQKFPNLESFLKVNPIKPSNN